MQTVTPGASHLEVTPIAYGTWQFGGDWESVDEQAAVAGRVHEGLTRPQATQPRGGSHERHRHEAVEGEIRPT